MPSAFNSLPVLPPCLRRSSVDFFFLPPKPQLRLLGIVDVSLGVQVVEWVGLIDFLILGIFQNFQGDVFHHAFYLGFVLQHMRRSEMSFKVR